MANIRKSFNLRDGVQVDDDNFIVNSNGLVGIGTSIPQAFLDVRGSSSADAVKIVGHTTATTFYAGIATVGILTVTQSLKVSGVVAASSFSGSASGLTGIYAVATDGWYINSGNSSISTTFKVGIETTNPLYSLQIGNPDSNEGISFSATTGDIVSTGGIAATSFSGYLDAGYLTGTISNDRIPVLQNSKIPNNFQVTGIITALGTFQGNLVGIATTARDLTSDARVSIVHIASNTSNIGISTVSTRLNVTGTLGVGTDSAQANVHIVQSGIASAHITGGTISLFTLGRSLSPTGNTGGLRFGNTSGLYPYSTTKSLDIINYDTGNINSYIHYGATGVGTGNFNWIYSPDPSNPLMTLTYGGNLGVGVSNPTHKLHVSGTASITTLSVTGSAYISGAGTSTTVRNLYVLNGQSGILDSEGNELLNKNVNITSGISTFNSISATNIGIGSDIPAQPLDIVGNVQVSQGDLYVGVNTSNGLILTSPNGTQYRLFVQDNGTLSTFSI